MIEVERRNNKLIDFINSEKARELCRKEGEKTFTRNRKIPYNDILLLSLNKQGKTTSFEIRDYELKKKGCENVNYSDEAYLKQRRHLNPEVFKEMNKIYLEDFYNSKKVKKIEDYLIMAIDGSTHEVPNTPTNKAYFGYQKNNESQSSQKARAQVSTLYDINNNFIVDALVDKYKTSEIELAKKNIENADNIIKDKRKIIIFDRGYPSIEFLMWLEKREIKFVIRFTKTDYKKERSEMKTNDEIVFLEHNKWRRKNVKKYFPEEYEEFCEKKGTKVRMTIIKLDVGNEEYLISNLDFNEFSYGELKELYNQRWKIETVYNTTKYKLKIESFTGNLPQFVYQDIYAQVVVYNQMQDMLSVENEEYIKEQKIKNNKLKYKINENKAIGIYKEKFIKILLIENQEQRTKEYNNFLNELRKYTTAIRLNRPSQPRIINLRSKYRTNFKSCF